MGVVYFDSSAFVKLLIEEDGSDEVNRLWDGCDLATSSRLAYPEVCAALAAARRNRDLDQRALAEALESWTDFWLATSPVELDATVERTAGELARLHSLRGADAVHLASALAVHEAGLVIAVWDQQLHAGARAEHLMVAPARLDR